MIHEQDGAGAALPPSLKIDSWVEDSRAALDAGRLLQQFAGKSLGIVVSESRAAAIAAALLGLAHPIAADFARGHICIIDVDENGAALRHWNVAAGETG